MPSQGLDSSHSGKQLLVADEVIASLSALADASQAQQVQRYFKTAPGQYGHGDIFIGVKVPQVRAVVKNSLKLTLQELDKLLQQPIHEYRLASLLIMNEQFSRLGRTRLLASLSGLLAPQEEFACGPVSPEEYRRRLICLYFARTHFINNWDLVDLSAGMVGQWYFERDRRFLHLLALSDNMWEQRIAMVACLVFVRSGQFSDAFAICTALINHPHDLIHKALGWVLREIGKKDKSALEEYLQNNLPKLSRTSLRAAIERFPEVERQIWLKR